MRPTLIFPCALVAFLAATASSATEVDYSLQSLGGTQYRYTYSIKNDGSAGGSLDLVDILFDPSLFQEGSLTISSDSALATNWSQQFLASAPGVPAAFDIAALNGGIAVGGSVSGFAVTFFWLGTGNPGSQRFEVYNGQTFDLLETGNTVAVVPLPAAFGLLAFGVGGLLSISRKSQRRQQKAL
jgi:hypothetical protein